MTELKLVCFMCTCIYLLVELVYTSVSGLSSLPTAIKVQFSPVLSWKVFSLSLSYYFLGGGGGVTTNPRILTPLQGGSHIADVFSHICSPASSSCAR